MSVETMLEQLVPEPDSFGDWDDVLQRARIKKHRKAVVTAAMAAVLLAILFATPAFGLLLDLIGRTNVSFSGSKAAPTRVQRNFFDMSLAEPKGMGPRAIVSQTRQVGTVDGHTLYVVPTRGGGFCWELEHAMGGCITKRERKLMVGGSLIERPGGLELMRRVDGEVLAPTARTLTVEYADGTSQQISFVWVTKPISAGFFSFAVPAGHQTKARPRAVTIRDRHGKLLAREPLFHARPRIPPHRVPPPPRTYRLPPPLPAPSAPLQQGSANGVSVVVGANGIAEFHVSNPHLRKASWVCFKFMQYHEVIPFELGYAHQAIHGDRIRIGSLRGPFDGCEVQAGYGRPWPDPHGYHAAVEIPFTPRAKRWFADRAAARKLVRYFRWSRHHPNAATTGITITHRGGETTYSVRSTTGKVFAIAVRDRKVVQENVTPYAGPL
jgi:hypothetical protein